MKRIIIFIIGYLFVVSLSAQSNYGEAIAQGDEALENRLYKMAINKYFAAEAFDPSMKKEVKEKVNEVFGKIEALRKNAEELQKKAEAEKVNTAEALKKVKYEQVRTSKALKAAKEAEGLAVSAQQAAQQALARAQQLIDAFYFYDGKFALAFKDNLFYFIDKEGREVERLGKWLEAKQFNEQINFARVKNDRLEDFFLDTLGNTYQVFTDPSIKNRKYLDFKGNNHVEISDASKYIADSSGITMAGWFNFDNLEKFQGLFGFRHTDGNIGYKDMGSGDGEMYVILIPDGKLECRYKVNDTLTEFVTPANTVIPKVWQHYAWIYDQNKLTLYLDGEMVGSVSTESGPITAKKRTFAIGKLMASHAFNGQIDEVSLWSKALNPSEIKDMMNNDLKGDETNLELYFKFNEGIPYGDNKSISKLTSAVKKEGREGDLVGFNLIGDNSNFGGIEVLAYDLSNKLLKEIPPEVLKQQRLKILLLPNNLLSDIPQDISGLENLEFLDLSGNKLTMLPVEIGDLTNLPSMDLSGNQLISIPTELGNLRKLTYLDLSDNRLTSLPSEIGNLTKLKNLILKDNELTKLPAAIGNLTNLPSMDLSGNLLDELPDELGKLFKLTKLDLADNRLTTLPAEVGKLKNLTGLWLSGNQLEKLPNELGELTNLTSLDLRNNKLKKLPIEIGKLTNLSTLTLNSNQLDTLPDEIGKLTNLTTLSLNSNQLATLPDEIGKLTNLTTLDLIFNKLKRLPGGLGELHNLTTLDLRGNQLDTLPDELGETLGNLTNLTTLHLSSNNLTTLPTTLGNLTNLTTLHLSNNRLTTLPKEIGNLTNLTTLTLDNNELASLPREIGNLTDLTELSLKGTRISRGWQREEIKSLLPINCVISYSERNR